MRLQRNLLWVDGGAAATAGILVLLARGWLSAWYRLPIDLLVFMGVVSLVYASYSLSLASRARRPMGLILLLVAANLAWAAACVRWAVVFSGTASGLGIAVLVAEALFVGGLAVLEWRWRHLLRSASAPPVSPAAAVALDE